MGQKAILVTPPIPAWVKRIESVRWWIKSHDQGYSGEPAENKGTYRCSWTWFEAAILRGSRVCRLEEDLVKTEEPVNITDPAVPYPEEGLEEVGVTVVGEELAEEVKTRWRVQSNVNSHRDPTEHVIEWFPHQKIPEEVLSDPGNTNSEEDVRTGHGFGIGFVDALKPGDRLVLIARATYPAWINNIRGAEVEIIFTTADL